MDTVTLTALRIVACTPHACPSVVRGAPDLDVRLGDGDELWVDAVDVEVLHLVPAVVRLEVDEAAVRARVGRAWSGLVLGLGSGLGSGSGSVWG